MEAARRRCSSGEERRLWPRRPSSTCPRGSATLHEAHVREPWGPNSVNQAATVLMAKAVATAFLAGGWNCKCGVAASRGRRRSSTSPRVSPARAAPNETGRLLAACFGDAWRDRVARVHPPRKHLTLSAANGLNRILLVSYCR